MQLLPLLPAFLLTSLTFARNDQVTLQQGSSDLNVPGRNPLNFCGEPDNYILDLDNVDLDPNPPQAGQALAISANGTLKSDVQEGAKVHIQVKYGVIRLLNQEVELCDYADQVDLKCPLTEGPKTLTKSVNLPKEIPNGKYTVMADVFNPDQSRITCLTAQVEFKKDTSAQNWWRRSELM